MSERPERESEREIAGLRVRSRREGAGRTLVFLHHSFGCPGWVPFLEELASDHQVVAPDLPGFGQSSRPDWARHPRDLSILLAQWISAEGFERPHLIGAGFGGWVAAELASMRDMAVRARETAQRLRVSAGDRAYPKRC